MWRTGQLRANGARIPLGVGEVEGSVEQDAGIGLAGHHVHDALRDAHGVIGVALVIAREQGDVDSRLDTVLPVCGKHDGEQLAVHAIHLRVLLGNARREADILTGDHCGSLVDDPLGQGTHVGEGRGELRGNRGIREAQPGLLGHVAGEISHSLEAGGDAQGPDGDSEVAACRGLIGDDLDAALLDSGCTHINLVIIGDDLLGDAEIGIEEGGGGPVHGGTDQLGDLDELVVDRQELVMRGVAHVGHPFQAICLPGARRGRRG